VVGWFGRRQRRASTIDVPPRREISVDEEAEEGVQLSEYASRMAIKNRMIIDAVRGDEPFDRAFYEGMVREELGRLVAEAEQSSLRMEDERASAGYATGRAASEHDYRRRDVDNLLRRQRVYEAVGRLLSERMNDPYYVEALYEAAHGDAWGEVAEAIEARMIRANAEPEEAVLPMSERERDAAKAFIARDLRVLEAEHNRAR
jgi:hypothetical protein